MNRESRCATNAERSHRCRRGSWKRCCARDEGWPFGAALRGEAPNRHLLRWLKTVVVSEVEKAHEMRQVGTRKTVRSPSLEGSLVTCRNAKMTSKPGVSSWPGRSLAGARFLARRCPARRRREPGLGSRTERGKARPDTAAPGGEARGSDPSGLHPQGREYRRGTRRRTGPQ
jgi:hypothetical protein